MQRYSVEKAYLFGSAATGKMTEDSDVDFVVKFKSGISYTEYGNNYFELIYALEDLLQKKVDITAEETLSNPYLIKSINSQKIAIL